MDDNRSWATVLRPKTGRHVTLLMQIPPTNARPAGSQSVRSGLDSRRSVHPGLDREARQPDLLPKVLSWCASSLPCNCRRVCVCVSVCLCACAQVYAGMPANGKRPQPTLL
jgi:hypothetical protein